MSAANENPPADHRHRGARPSSASGSPRSDFVAVDTEFMRENTYWPDLCLVQVANREEAAAIDPKAEGIDLTPAARPAGQQRGRAQGLPRRRAGHRDHLQPHRQDPASRCSTPRSRRWRSGSASRSAIRTWSRAWLGKHPRQGRALHRLGAPPARQAPDRLCDRRRHPSRRRSSRRCSSGCARPAAATGSTRRWSGSPIPANYANDPGAGLEAGQDRRAASPTCSAG